LLLLVLEHVPVDVKLARSAARRASGRCGEEGVADRRAGDASRRGPGVTAQVGAAREATRASARLASADSSSGYARRSTAPRAAAANGAGAGSRARSSSARLARLLRAARRRTPSAAVPALAGLAWGADESAMRRRGVPARARRAASRARIGEQDRRRGGPAREGDDGRGSLLDSSAGG
jgi:hypothetical protein